MVGWGTIVGSAAPQCSSPSTARAALCPQTKVPQSTERTPQAMKAALWGHEQGAGGTEPTPSNMPPPGPRPPGCGALCGRSAFSAMLLCIAPGGWPKTPAAPPAHTRAHCNDTRNLVKSLAAATTRPPRFCLCPAAPLRGHRPTSAPHAQAWPLPHPPSPHPTAACPHPCPIPSPVTCGSAPPCPPLAGHTAPLLNWTPSPQDVALTPKPRCCSVVGLSAPCTFPNCPRQAGTVPIAPAHVVPSS